MEDWQVYNGIYDVIEQAKGRYREDGESRAVGVLCDLQRDIKDWWLSYLLDDMEPAERRVKSEV